MEEDIPADTAPTGPTLVGLDQTLLVFDVEQQNNSKHVITLKKLSSQPIIAWTFKTNAPTRYLVNPAKGFLTNEINTVKVTVELVNNLYHPKHRMLVCAMPIAPQNVGKVTELWKQAGDDSDSVHTIPLQLTTTYLHLAHTSHMGNKNSNVEQYKAILDRMDTVGEERVRELEKLLDILRADSNQLDANLQQTRNLERVLGEQIREKAAQVEQMERSISALDAESHRIAGELARDEAELKLLRSGLGGNPNATPCSIM